MNGFRVILQSMCDVSLGLTWQGERIEVFFTVSILKEICACVIVLLSYYVTLLLLALSIR